VNVSDVQTTTDSISFTVDQVGVPVLVRMSFYPNWEASGAEGPYRVAPNFMVVVPTENQVELTYGTTSMEWIAYLMTLVGIALVVVLWRKGPLEIDDEEERETAATVFAGAGAAAAPVDPWSVEGSRTVDATGDPTPPGGLVRPPDESVDDTAASGGVEPVEAVAPAAAVEPADAVDDTAESEAPETGGDSADAIGLEPDEPFEPEVEPVEPAVEPAVEPVEPEVEPAEPAANDADNDPDDTAPTDDPLASDEPPSTPAPRPDDPSPPPTAR
jgi:hypothetical protein